MTSYLYVKETPWKGLGTQYSTQPDSAEDLVKKAKLDWDCIALPMSTERDEKIYGYKAIYREDTKGLLGVVNKNNPVIVQNRNMFVAFDFLLGNEVDVESATSFDNGRTVFGSFKIHQQYKLFDDEIDHYFVCVNDHLKPDGMVSILNTPVRIVCQNTLEMAMNKNFYNIRVPVGEDDDANRSVAATIIESAGNAILNLQKRSEEFFKKKIGPTYVDRLMEELFPFVEADEESLHNKQNEKIAMMRDTFKDECLDADNLNNYRGTQFAVLNALIDFDQHYIKNSEKAYDIGYRMKKLPGIGTPSEPSNVQKFLKIADKIAA